MNFTFKVKVFSGDGQTFLRNILLHIPAATADGRSQVTSYFNYYTSGTTAFSTVLEQLRGQSYCKVLLDEASTMLSVGPFARYASLAGASNVIDVPRFFSPSPAQGQSVRLVFNNESYIIMTMTQYVDSGYDETVKLKFEYFLPDGTSQGSITTGEITGRYDEPNPCGGFFIFFPMALPNTAGVFTDTFLRCPLGDTGAIPSRMGGTYFNENYTISGSIGPTSYTPAESSTIDLTHFIDGVIPVDTDDPYQDIENSTPSGPAEGVGIPSSDPVDIPGLPTFSATDTGFITLFNPTLSQVKALADYMWNGLFDVNNLRKIVADPMDCILGFNMLPVAIPSSGSGDVCIGNIISSVSMDIASSQWVEVDCGQLDLGLPYGSYLDFSPYTKYSIYLPYIGTCDLSADDVAGKVLTLKYHVDVLSCSCVAYLKCGDSVLYQWTGSCGYSIPVTQNDFSRMIMAIIGVATATIGGAVVGGAGMALTRGVESAAKNVMGLKPDVHRSGAIGSSAGLMGGQTPYLILEVPKACKPAKQYHYLGYPSFTTVKLGDVSGRQDFESVILDGIPCTEEERDMIAAACQGGIYL